jgi:hypothetical protein
MIVTAGDWLGGHGASVLPLVAGRDHAVVGQHPAAARSASQIRRRSLPGGCSTARQRLLAAQPSPAPDAHRRKAASLKVCRDGRRARWAPAAHAARRIEGQAARLLAAGAYVAWREKGLRDNSLVMRDPPGQRVLRATRGPWP